MKYSFHWFSLETTYFETNIDRNLLQIRSVSILSHKRPRSELEVRHVKLPWQCVISTESL